MSELYNIANDLHLRVPDMGRMIEKLNDAGGQNMPSAHGYQVLSCVVRV